MEKVFLEIGGNIGNVDQTFDIAIEKINIHIGKIINVSSRYKTEPWGYQNQNFFLNQVVYLNTVLSPAEVLEQTQLIENLLGRKRDANNQFAPRSIDIDILFYGDRIIKNSELVVPHPRLHLRNFVLIPLTEISPKLVHPCFNKTIEELLKETMDKSLVKKA